MKIMKKLENQNLIKSSLKSADNEINGIEALKKSKKAGFSLIELVVVVAIIAVLVGFTAGSLASVNRRKATKIGKLIDSELTVLASHAYSRDGIWRLQFTYDEAEDVTILTHQYNTSSLNDDDFDTKWVDFESVYLPYSIDISFGGDEYSEDNSLKNNDDLRNAGVFVSVSREKGHYLTDGKFDGYFCDNIHVHSAAKVVTIEMFSESGGHRVID
jgi:prepilin-type N-terminal cleavage/methylation domain-containing protein